MPARILIAEDDASLLYLLAHALESDGYTVLSARDGAEALTIAERERPDLIVSDVMMPRLSGIELAATLHARENGLTPPILLLSASRPSGCPTAPCSCPSPSTSTTSCDRLPPSCTIRPRTADTRREVPRAIAS